MTVLPVTRIRSGFDPFVQQRRLGGRRRRVEDLRQAVGQASVHLLREGTVDVVGAQARLHVGDGDHAVEGGQSGGEGGGGVAVHQHQVGLGLLQQGVDAVEHRRGDVAQGLALAHDLEVVVHGKGEGVDDLVEHLPVLPGEAGDDAEDAPALELQHHGRHLDGLRPGAEGDEHGMVGHARSRAPCLCSSVRTSLGTRSAGRTP